MTICIEQYKKNYVLTTYHYTQKKPMTKNLNLQYHDSKYNNIILYILILITLINALFYHTL